MNSRGRRPILDLDRGQGDKGRISEDQQVDPLGGTNGSVSRGDPGTKRSTL